MRGVQQADKNTCLELWGEDRTGLCVSQWQLQTQVLDGLTRKEQGNQVKDEAWGSANVVWILCRVQSDGMFFGNCSSRNWRVQINSFSRHSEPRANLWISKQAKIAKGFSFPWVTYFKLKKKKKSFWKLRFPILLCLCPENLLPHHYPRSLTVIIPPGPGVRQYQQVEFCVVSTDIREPSLTNCFSASGWLNAFLIAFKR